MQIWKFKIEKIHAGTNKHALLGIAHSRMTLIHVCMILGRHFNPKRSIRNENGNETPSNQIPYDFIKNEMKVRVNTYLFDLALSYSGCRDVPKSMF